ncbi:MAG TPA: GIY-YIG nuclease family protein, partial [Tepidisphaeraceae bacterium]|nr:GIY-YIG nuclease family protein [Tepidisphaeraceae bacterium]
TNDLERRVLDHKLKRDPACFTARYHCDRLVWHEAFHDVRDAIAWEKRLKGWRREKKVALIEERNPQWEDLAADAVRDAGPRAPAGVRDAEIPRGYARDDNGPGRGAGPARVPRDDVSVLPPARRRWT